MGKSCWGFLIAFDEGERKPNFVFASCVFRVGVPVYGYAEFFVVTSLLVN